MARRNQRRNRRRRRTAPVSRLPGWNAVKKVLPPKPAPLANVTPPMPGEIPGGALPTGLMSMSSMMKVPPLAPALPDPNVIPPMPGELPGGPLPPGLEQAPPSGVPPQSPPINPDLPPEPPPTEPPPPAPAPANDGTLTPNPQLASAPLGAYTDAQYEAQRALLERDTRRAYSDVLRQLGFTQDGQYVPGEVETTATRTRGDLGQGLTRASLATRQNAQNEGNLWSGYFAKTLAENQEPFVRGLADLDIATPRQLADLRAQALSVLSDYDLQHYAMLGEAAQRRASQMGGVQ